MFLEVTTLILLLIVLATRWATSRSADNLKLERAELENQYSKLRTDYNALFEKRKSDEALLQELESDVAHLKKILEETKADLEDQLDRNAELEG